MKRFVSFFIFALVLAFAGVSYAQEEVEKCFNYLKAGDYKRAIEAGQKAVRFYPRNFDAHLCLGDSYRMVGELDLALSSFKEAERLAVYKDDLRGVYNRLGLVYSDKGDLDNALFYFSRYLSLSRELGDKRGEATALNNIASIYQDKGDLDKALDYYEESLKLKTDEKDKAPTYNNIASIYTQKEDYTKAIEYLKKAIEIVTRFGDYHSAAIHLLNLGDTYRRAKDFSKADEYLNDGLKRILKVGDKFWEAGAYKYLGLFYRDTGNIKLARDYLQKAYELFTSIGAKEEAADAKFNLIVLDLSKKRNLFGGIEIGSKGVKAVVVEISPADEEGFYNVNEKMRRTVNTTIISGVAETGIFQDDAIEETAKAVKGLMDEIRDKEKVKMEDIYIIGSSAIFKVKNRDLLAEKIKSLTNKEMYFVDKEGEVLYNIFGTVPQKYWTKALLIDIGSGNTKMGYIEGNSQRTVSIEIPFGSVSFTDAVKKTNLQESVYVKEALKLANKEITPKLKNEASRKPSLLNRTPVYMVGGIVWAMATILYPERQDSFVKLTAGDINRFYNMVTSKKDKIFDVDVSKIKDSNIKEKALKQLQSVKDVFSSDNLIAGATILKTISDTLKLQGREIYFARKGNWMYGFIVATGIEKTENKGGQGL